MVTYTFLSFQLAEVYGDVFALRLGRDQFVFAAGYKMVKEALVGQAENFVDRPFSPMGERMYPGNGEKIDFCINPCHFMSCVYVWDTCSTDWLRVNSHADWDNVRLTCVNLLLDHM